MSLREDILALSDLKSESVAVPEWGGISVTVREMSLRRYLEWHRLAYDAESKPTENHRGLLLAFTLTDADGNLIFTPEDAAALEARNADATINLLGVAKRINGMTDRQAKADEKN